jgi:hypothetical protein
MDRKEKRSERLKKAVFAYKCSGKTLLCQLVSMLTRRPDAFKHVLK